MDDSDLSKRLDAFQEGFDAVVRGLKQMAETQAIQTDMLAKIMEAASQPEPESDLARSLERMAGTLAGNTEAIEQISQQLEHLPSQIADALTAEV